MNTGNTTTTSGNAHERAARANKVQAMLGAFDAVRGAIGHDAALRVARSWSAADWRRLAICAGCRPPSPTTIDIVLHLLAKRTEDPFARVSR